MFPAGRAGAAMLGLVVLAAARVAAADPVPAFVDTVRIAPGAGTGCLARPYVLPSTLDLTLDGRSLGSDDYFLDARTGCFTLVAPDTQGVGRVAVARYRALALDLVGSLQLREDPRVRSAPVQQLPEQTEPDPTFNSPEAASGLSVSGSKTFGIEVGSRRDLKLRQSLDLRLSGQVSREVTLLAILSDQDVPFQPEGNTAELAELDRILVELRSPQAGASLGDVRMSQSGMEFMTVEREMEGFTGIATLSGVESRGAIASAKGEFASREFFGEDGKQGPYRLSDRAGNSEVVVVAGSERIWIDGQLLQRGQEEDYVIDYALGEITFTSRRVITANTEISVDYQYATSRYRRQVAFAAVGREVPGAGRLEAAFFDEGDDPDNPFGGELSAEERAALAAVGDSALVAGGTRYVGPGLGDYQLVVDTVTGKAIFVFVEGTGDYQVTFVDVGEGKGSYEVDPGSTGTKKVYRFIGEGEGQYIPRRDLPAPEKRQVADLRWDAEGSVASLAIEGAFSSTDGNVLSPVDDDDNDGGALVARGALKPVPLGAGFRIAPRATVRRVGANFRSPGRLRPGFYGREWNLSGSEEIRDESLQQGGFELDWTERLRWDSEIAHLALADTFSAVRQAQRLAWNDVHLRANAGWTTSRDDQNEGRGELDRWDGETTILVLPLQPRVKGLHETRRRPAGGERHRDWEVGVFLPPVGPLRAELGGGRRLDDSLTVATGGWREAQDARRIFGELEGRFPDLTVRLRYEARRVTTGGDDTSRERRDTGRFDLRHQASRGAWTANLDAEVGTVGLRRRTKTIVPAATDSTGFYDEFGNYVGSGGGYDVEYGAPGAETLTGRMDLSTRLRWSPPGDDHPAPAWTRAFAWEGYLNLDESSLLPLTTPRYFLNPGSYLDRNSTIDGRLNQRQTLDLLPTRRDFGFRFRQEAIRRIVRNPQSVGDDLVELQSEDRFTATLRSNPAPGWDAELEGGLGRREEEVDNGTSSLAQNTRVREATVRGGRRFDVLQGNTRLSTEITYSRETGPDQLAEGWVFRPRMQWSLARRGRIDLRYSLTELTRREGFTSLRGVGSSALTEGWRVDALGEIRITPGITFTSVLALSRPTGFVATTEARMELRGSF